MSGAESIVYLLVMHQKRAVTRVQWLYFTSWLLSSLFYHPSHVRHMVPNLISSGPRPARPSRLRNYFICCKDSGKVLSFLQMTYRYISPLISQQTIRKTTLNQQKQAKAINPTLLAEDILGHIDITRNLLGTFSSYFKLGRHPQFHLSSGRTFIVRDLRILPQARTLHGHPRGKFSSQASYPSL